MFSFMMEGFSDVFVPSRKYFFLSLISVSLSWILCIPLMSIPFVLLVLIFLCTSALSVIQIISISAPVSLSHSYEACINLFQVIFYSVLFSVPLLGTVLSPFHRVECFICHPFFFFFFFFFRIISSADITKATLRFSFSYFICF